MIEKIVNGYANDRQKLLSELRDLIKEGKRSGDLFLVGASYYYIAKNAYYVGDRDELLVKNLDKTRGTSLTGAFVTYSK